jgi:SAM-dependent methyltransferase
MRALARAMRKSGFYEDQAAVYFENTRHSDVSELHERFLAGIPAGGLILDAGSGSGRDTRAFRERGYRVEAFDSSTALAALSFRETGVRTEVLAFEKYMPRAARYDGIWALASLLHVSGSELPRVVAALGESLKPGGVLFATFKSGEVDSVDDLGRSFTNMTTLAADHLFRMVDMFQHIDVAQMAGAASFGHQVEWIHVLACR